MLERRATYVAIGTAAAVLAGAAALVTYPRLGRQADGSYLVPTGQKLTPAGRHIEVDDRPLGMVLSPDGGRLAVVTGSNFAPRALHILDARQGTALDRVPIGDSFVGVAFSLDGKTLYVGGGASDAVKVLREQSGGKFQQQDAFPMKGGAPSGLSLSPDGTTLYVALNSKHTVAVIHLPTREVTEIAVGMHPYTTIAARAENKVYVSNWAGRKAREGDSTDEFHKIVVDPRTGIPSTGTVSVIDTAKKSVVGEIDVGLHPSALALNQKGDRLFVANANSDTVSVIDTTTDTVLRSINVRPGVRAPIGSAPNALSVSPDSKTLYVANAANNAIAVVDLTSPPERLRGFFPTGWYPTAVTALPDGKRVWVASGYGFGSIAPLADGKTGRSYRDRVGVVSLIDVSGGIHLDKTTAQVQDNNRLVRSGVVPGSRHPIPMDARQGSPIRHVFYIIKENRTYDQLFGDIPQGNGDASLVQFGRDVSPNHHALAEQFVLLDNFYTPADQSALGHRWCTQGYASDWIFKYGNARNDVNPMLYAPNDFLWDNAKAQGVSVRSYGERGTNTFTPASATFMDFYEGWKSGDMKVSVKPKTFIPGLKDVYHPEYPAFGGKVPDQYRADIFLKEFREFEKNGNLPRLSILLLPNDHTNGTSPGLPTPRASVADNDLALGRIVEAISNSRYWKESAIFVVEDDAQNGVDHVAGHRTIALLISPWVRRKTVDSHFYTTINLYRTIEQILGLPPQNQFDLAAEPMFPAFTDQPDVTSYKALPNKIPLNELNPPLKALSGQGLRDAIASMKMDFSEPDAAPEQLLNRIVWRATRGIDTPYPRRPEEHSR
jgi:YVTN family beta-propeller protein